MDNYTVCASIHVHTTLVPQHTYKFLRDGNFIDDPWPNLGLQQFYFRGSLIIPCASSVFRLFYNFKILIAWMTS